MNEYRQRALNRVNNTSGNAGSTTSTYRQRALNRQQSKGEEMAETKLETNAYLDTKPITAEAVVGANAETNGVDPQEASKVLNDLIKAAESRVVKADSLSDYAKKLSPERIQEIKETSAILNPEKYHKDVDLGYYGRRAVEGMGSALESFADNMVRARENVSYPVLKAGEFVTSLGGKYDNRLSDTFGKLLERNKEASIEAVKSTPVESFAKKTNFIYNDINGLQKLAGDVVSGGAAMLPMVAANAVVPGSGYAILGAQGYGSGIQQAYQKTGELGLKEDIYGLLSGLAEVGVEKLSGGIGGLGNGAIDNIASKMIKNGFIRSATGEGIEEAITTFIDPYLQRLTYDKGAEGAKASEVLRSALVGALTSMLLQGGSVAINAPSNIAQKVEENKQNRQDLQNSLVGLEKMLPTYEIQSKSATSQENVVRGLPTNDFQEQGKQTILPTQKIQETVNSAKIAGMSDFDVEKATEIQIQQPVDQSTVQETETTQVDEFDYRMKLFDELAEKGYAEYRVVNGNTEMFRTDKWNDEAQKIYDRIRDSQIKETESLKLQLPTANDETAQTSNMEQIVGNEEKVAQFSKKTDVAGEKPAFSMPKNYIDPSQDIQKATEFINKATVEDIDTLNKMVEEAEKYPDRLDLQFFAEKARARLEKLSREQIENMLEEGIDTNKISYNDSLYRNVRRVLGDKGYQYVKEHILDKLDAAKLDNVNMKIKYANELKSYVVDELGIKKDSKQSELVQNYGEKEITLDELKEATPNWENVVKADNWFRSKYDELIDMLNESRTEIYPYVEERIEATELELEVVKQQIKDIEENGTPNYKKDAEIRTQIENIQKRIDAKDEKLKSIKNKDTLAYKNNLRIKNEAVERLNDLNDLLDIRAENKLDKLKAKADKLQKILDSEELWRGKRIPKRKDYYRHFQEMTEGFEALGNILATPSEISNQLSGISENTKPNSKWLGLAQRRLTNKTKYDAVGGFLNYLDSASYAINIDPEIKRIRDFTEEIRNASGDNTTANRLIEYLTDYANDLAGKTNPMDRYLQKVIPGGRKTMKAISWLTNRIKSNAVLGNFNSAAAQILNLPQGLADIKNPKNIGIGFWETLTGKDSRYKDSQFITERFESDVYSQFDEKLIDQPKKFATWLLGALDEFGTKTIWNGEYSKAVDMGIKDPVRYADYRTRDLVAGRGIGELSLNQRSKTIGLLAPFTVEVSNYWGVVKDFISAKDFGGLILLQVFGHLFNEGLEELGISAGVFDLIDALIDAWNTEGGVDKKVGRVAGEYLSNTMFGQQLASLYPENGADLGVYKLPTRSELFGDADPTRMGTGSVLSKAISNPITSVVMPWGGTQLNKTAQGLSTFAKGGSYTKDAEGNPKLKYPVEQNFENLIKSMVFGKWATQGAKDYIDRGFKSLSAKQTEGYEKAMKAGISSDDFFKAYDATRGIEGDKDKNGKAIENSKSKKLKEAIDKATTKLTSKQRKILYDAFNVSKTVQGGNSQLPTEADFKVKLPQVKIEK